MEVAAKIDRRYDVVCMSTGSRPSAIITWYKANKQLRRVRVSRKADKNNNNNNTETKTRHFGRLLYLCRQKKKKLYKTDLAYSKA